MLFWQHLGLNQSWNGVGPKRSQTLLTQQILFFTKFLKHMVTNFPCMLMQCLTCWFPVEHVTCFSSVMGSLPNDPWLLRGKRFQMMAVGEKTWGCLFCSTPPPPFHWHHFHRDTCQVPEKLWKRWWAILAKASMPQWSQLSSAMQVGNILRNGFNFQWTPMDAAVSLSIMGKELNKETCMHAPQNKASFFRGLWL